VIDGSAWYVGAPGAGKTSLAWNHLRALVAADHNPALIIDHVRDSRFERVPVAPTLEVALSMLWKQRASCRVLANSAYWTRGPDGRAATGNEPSQLDRLFEAALEAGRVHVLVDETGFVLNSRSDTNAPLPRLARSFRHARITLQCTTQNPIGDLASGMLVCAPHVFVFFVPANAPLVLEELERRHGLARDRVLALPLGAAEAGGVRVRFFELTARGEALERDEFIPDRA
jgi:hypothetical protein